MFTIIYLLSVQSSLPLSVPCFQGQLKFQAHLELQGVHLDLERALLHNLQQSGGPWPLWPPFPTSLIRKLKTGRIEEQPLVAYHNVAWKSELCSLVPLPARQSV